MFRAADPNGQFMVFSVCPGRWYGYRVNLSLAELAGGEYNTFVGKSMFL